ncbi:hypothetical protein C4J83_2118 [Pseudomonas sp. LBUM920]|nr:hypothetical protein C4J83_2118 [Pseudomonas sp. LBUM920]
MTWASFFVRLVEGGEVINSVWKPVGAGLLAKAVGQPERF